MATAAGDLVMGDGDRQFLVVCVSLTVLDHEKQT
jgi:hypothetical protein